MYTSSIPSISLSISRCASVSSVPSTASIALLNDARLHSAIDAALTTARNSRREYPLNINEDIVERSALVRRERGLYAAKQAVAEADELAVLRTRPLELGDGPMPKIITPRLKEPYQYIGSALDDAGDAKWRGRMAAAASSMQSLRKARGTKSDKGFAIAAAAVSYVEPKKTSCRHVPIINTTPWGRTMGCNTNAAHDAAVVSGEGEDIERLIAERPFLSYCEYISNSREVGSRAPQCI